MAHKTETGSNSSRIARVGKRKWGYDSAEVDTFLERAHALYDSDELQLTQHDIQNVSFDLSKGGYVIAQVDGVLARLERAVVDKQTTFEIAQRGRVAWKAQTEQMYRQLDELAKRAPGERFKSGKPKAPSYDRKQVDRIIDQIMDKAAAELHIDGSSAEDITRLADVNSNSVENVVFTQRKGKRGYDERQVDYYLNACVELLSRLESYERVADFVNGENAGMNTAATTETDVQTTSVFTPAGAAAATAGVATGINGLSNETQATQPVTSLFASTPSAPAATMPQQTFDEPTDTSFESLSVAERAIFEPADGATTPTSAAAAATAADAPTFDAQSQYTAQINNPTQTIASSFAATDTNVPPTFAPQTATTATPAASINAATDAPTMSWGQGIPSTPAAATPAPAAAPAAPVTPAATSPVDTQNAALAGLAALAAKTAPEAPSPVSQFAPAAPTASAAASVDQPSEGETTAAFDPFADENDDVNNTPQPTPAPTTPTQPAAQSQRRNVFGGDFDYGNDGFSMEIPDLSFPTFPKQNDDSSRQ